MRADTADRTVIRIDARPRELVRTVGLPVAPDALAPDGNSLWVAGRRGTGGGEPGEDVVLVRIGEAADSPAEVHRSGDGYAVAAADGAGVWLGANDSTTLEYIDRDRGAITATVCCGVTPEALAAQPGALWVVERYDQVVTRVDASTGRVTHSIPFGAPIPPGRASTIHRPLSAAALGAGALWVSDAIEGKLWRFDPVDQSVEATIATGVGARGLAVTSRAVWVANDNAGTVSRIDPQTNTLVATILVAGRVSGVAAGPSGVWVSVP